LASPIIPMPSEQDLLLAYRSGPEGAMLADGWLNAVIGGAGRPLPSKPLPSKPLPEVPVERYGWRLWGLNPEGLLISPFVGAAVAGSPFEAPCGACGGEAPAPDCRCGIHYNPNTDLLFTRTPHCWFLRPGYKPHENEVSMQRYAPTLYSMLKGHLPFLLTYGVALGGRGGR
jgi:hypothetical protein